MAEDKVAQDTSQTVDAQPDNELVSAIFQASASEIDTIFESYRQLHEIYSTSFANLEKALDELPNQYKGKVANAKKAFNNTLSTVEQRQIQISDQLYSQGLILLVGNAESLTREMFHALLRLNIRKLNLKKDISLPLSDVLRAETDDELGELVISILEADGNPTEKLNFQNMKQLQGIMSGYLGLNIDNELVKNLHEYWQIRHIVIHNGAIVDQKFIDNLVKAGVSTEKYQLGQIAKVTKKDYDTCFALLVLLFGNFDDEISRLNLKYNGS